MIETCYGIPGCGKTYFAVQKALEYMASGGVVFTNIRFHGVQLSSDFDNGPVPLMNLWELGPDSNVIKVLKKEYAWNYQSVGGGQYHYIDLDTMDNDFLSAIPRGSPAKRILLILDEVNEWFDSLDTGVLKQKDVKGQKYRELFKFLRLSRHYYIDVLFLLQSFNTLNARIRDWCAFLWKSTDMQKMRVPGVPFRFPFPWFLWQQFDKGNKHCLKTLTWPKKQSIFSCYDSYCEFGAVGLSSASFNSDFSGKGKLQRAGGKKMNNVERIALFACLVCCVFMCWSVSGRTGGGVSGLPVVSRVVVTNTVEVVPEAATVEARPKYAPSTSVEYAPISFSSDGRDTFAYAAGRLFRVGMSVPQGRVVQIEKWGIRILGEEGEHWIYHYDMVSGGGSYRANQEFNQTSRHSDFQSVNVTSN